LSAAERLAALVEAGDVTVATAESITGGAVGEALIAMPGSGQWMIGGVIAYASRAKYDVLGVPTGPVISERAAKAMADGARHLLNTDLGIATTGCAGPESMEDQPVGTLWVGVAVGDTLHAEHHVLTGDPEEVRAAAVERALAAAATVLERA
jgi:PncC family amidohydrolase